MCLCVVFVCALCVCEFMSSCVLRVSVFARVCGGVRMNVCVCVCVLVHGVHLHVYVVMRLCVLYGLCHSLFVCVVCSVSVSVCMCLRLVCSRVYVLMLACQCVCSVFVR